MRDRQLLDKMRDSFRNGGNLAEALALIKTNDALQELDDDVLDGVAGGVITEENTVHAMTVVYWWKRLNGTKSELDEELATFFTMESDFYGATQDELQSLVDKYWAYDIDQLKEMCK